MIASDNIAWTRIIRLIIHFMHYFKRRVTQMTFLFHSHHFHTKESLLSSPLRGRRSQFHAHSAESARTRRIISRASAVWIMLYQFMLLALDMPLHYLEVWALNLILRHLK